MGWTTPRILKNATIAVAHQTAFGAAASSGGTIARAQCLHSDVDRGTKYIDPQGTTGSEFLRDTHTEAATAPGAKLRFYAGNRLFLAALLEHATHGQPIATLANSDLSEAGDTSNFLSAWTLTGVRPGFNTDSAAILYVKLTDENPGAGQALVQLYSDSARTALVASGSAADLGTVTLAAQNNSGLSGTVALATVTSSFLTQITLTVLRVRPQRSSVIARYFTLFRDTGQELQTIADCTVSRLHFSSAENGPLVVEADIVGVTYAIAATALSAALDAAEYYMHSHVAVTHNSNSESAISLAHGIEHMVEQDLANSATPIAIWKRGSKLLPLEVVQRFAAESRTIYDDGAAGTWRAVVATYTYGGAKDLVFTYPRAKLVNPNLPASAERAWDDHRLVLESRDDGVNDPLTVTLKI